jgi:hypothetical protein
VDAPPGQEHFRKIERLKKYCSHLKRGFFGFWRGFGEGAGLKSPVTEPKRSQNQKRPLLFSIFSNGYSIFENALTVQWKVPDKNRTNLLQSFHTLPPPLRQNESADESPLN